MGSGSCRSGQRLVEVGQQVIDVLDADGQAHRFRAYTRAGQFLGRELPVGSRRRVGSQRAHVADVDQPGEELQCVQELLAARTSTLQAKSEDARALPAQVLLRERVVRVAGQTVFCPEA